MQIATENFSEAGLSIPLNRSAEGSGSKKLTKTPGVGFFLAADVKSVVAITDAGREIPLFHYEYAITLPADEQVDPASETQRAELLRAAEQQFLQNVKCAEQQLERLVGPTLAANCHGWIFFGGRIGIKDEYIDQILQDNGYRMIDQPMQGDVAIYRDGAMIVHSGLVVTAPDCPPQVESKWGPFSVFRHAANDYHRGTCQFYRSSRPSHALLLRPTAVSPASKQ